MNNKAAEQAAKEFEEYCSQFPDWYWKYGLHDAEILSVSEIELTPDWKSKHPRRNCLKIHLDSSDAMSERNICMIRLYNYKIKTPELDLNNLEHTWWISDTLTQLPNNHFLLEICIETVRGKRKQFMFAVEFEIPEVERK